MPTAWHTNRRIMELSLQISWICCNLPSKFIHSKWSVNMFHEITSGTWNLICHDGTDSKEIYAAESFLWVCVVFLWNVSSKIFEFLKSLKLAHFTCNMRDLICLQQVFGAWKIYLLQLLFYVHVPLTILWYHFSTLIQM